MNRENIEYCIELMKGAKALDMRSWQHQNYRGLLEPRDLSRRAASLSPFRRVGL